MIEARDLDFGDMYADNIFYPLQTFSQQWNVPEKNFLDHVIDQKRDDFWKAVKAFCHAKAHNTFIIERGYRGVPPEWAHEQPRRWNDATTELNDLADRMVQAHEELLRTARSRLRN